MSDNLLSALEAAHFPQVPLCHQAAARIRDLEADLARVTEAGEASKALLDVVAERDRQISSEGWTPEHDDAHDEGELARAAATYALHSSGKYGNRALTWPWRYDWWKPTTPRRDLVKAGALILAEIERLDRMGEPQ